MPPLDWEGNLTLNLWLGLVGLALLFKEDNDGTCLLTFLISIIRFPICLSSLVKRWARLTSDSLLGNPCCERQIRTDYPESERNSSTSHKTSLTSLRFGIDCLVILMKTFNLISDILIRSQCRFAANCLASQTEHPRQMHLEAWEYIKSSSKFWKP